MDSIPFKASSEPGPESFLLMIIIVLILVFAFFLFNRFIKNKYNQIGIEKDNKLHTIDKLPLSLNTTLFIVTNGKREWLVCESSKTVRIIENEKDIDLSSENKET